MFTKPSLNSDIEISLVVPLYKCSKTIGELCHRVIAVLDKLKLKFEIILINDGSPEIDWEIVKEISKKNKFIKGINLSRNFGQHYAISAGLEKSIGNWIVVMDGDLQDKPEEIEKLYVKSREGFDIVLARRFQRDDSFFKKLSSLIFYKTFGYLTDTKYDNTVANFGIYNRTSIDSIIKIRDKIRVFPILVQWIGFNKGYIDVEHNKRIEGKSSYTYTKLFKLAIDIIISFSNKPLKLTVRLGFFITFFSLLIGLFYAIRFFNGDILVEGYTSLIISIWFLSGVIIFSIGVLGLYMGKIFDGVKDRPYYIIRNKINF